MVIAGASANCLGSAEAGVSVGEGTGVAADAADAVGGTGVAAVAGGCVGTRVGISVGDGVGTWVAVVAVSPPQAANITARMGASKISLFKAMWSVISNRFP